MNQRDDKNPPKHSGKGGRVGFRPPRTGHLRTGYKYLLRSVAAADGDRSLSTPPTHYYVEDGAP